MIDFKVVNEDIETVLPTRATAGSAAYDIRAVEDITLQPKSQTVVSTNITARFPKGIVFNIRSKSGLAFKSAIHAFHGVIDSDYFPNEIKVLLTNASDEPFQIHKQDKIAQGIFAPVMFVTDEEAIATERSGGFGSTGK